MYNMGAMTRHVLHNGITLEQRKAMIATAADQRYVEFTELSTREITSRRGSNDGLVSRTFYAEVPPRVEYVINEKARGLGPTREAFTS